MRKLINLENIQDMPYTGLVVTEALRYQSPAVSTSRYFVLQDIKIGNLTLYKDDFIQIYIEGLHHNSKEWQRPSEFLPQRFDW